MQEERIRGLEGKVYPTEAEVSRLIKENNMLHEQLIQEKQIASSAESKIMLCVKREQDIKADFSFMLGSRDTRVQSLVDENFSLKSKLQEVVEKCLSFKDNQKNDKLSTELRKKIAEILSLTTEIKNGSSAYYQMASALRKADEEYSKTKSILITLEGEKIGMKSSMEAKDQALILRDREIKRLQSKVMDEGISHLQDYWHKNYSE